jgi:hypothetical protein
MPVLSEPDPTPASRRASQHRCVRRSIRIGIEDVHLGQPFTGPSSSRGMRGKDARFPANPRKSGGCKIVIPHINVDRVASTRLLAPQLEKNEAAAVRRQLLSSIELEKLAHLT